MGSALHRLLANSNATLSPADPVLTLPAHRKGDPEPDPGPHPASHGAHDHLPAAVSPSHAGSGSHIEFHTSDSDSELDSSLHSNNSHDDDDDDLEHHHHHFHHDDQINSGPTFNLHYAKNQPPPPSVSYYEPQQQRPSSPPGYANYSNFVAPNPDYNSYNPYNPYPYPDNYGNAMGGGGGGGYQNSYMGGGGGMGFFGSAAPPPQPNYRRPMDASGAGPSTSKAPPPPPSPPRASTWDFLNPFEVQDSYFPPYTPSRSSREVRDEEGIPDLEDEEHEVVKQAYGDNQKFAASTSSSSIASPEGKGKGKGIGENSRSVEVKDDENVVEKNVVGDEVQNSAPQVERTNNVGARQYKDVSEIGSEIKTQFDRAFEAAAEVSKVLEVGKHPYHHRKSSVMEVSSRMMCVMPTSTSEDFLSLEEDMVTSSKNLSSTLQKLYIWEKKLQDEVRAEEKMRLLHDRNCKRLKHLDERGAEAHKLDDVQRLIRKLSTKIRIAIQVVDSISNKINKLRDEELLPQINELIQGLTGMWKIMLECHRIQCQAISEAKGLDSISSGGNLSDSAMGAAMQLEVELLRWIGNFSTWINAQRNYVRALNGWLILCLHYEPEVTADGVAPYSPGRIGAPPVFVICNYWSQAIGSISEKEAVDAMQAFASNLRRVWEQHSVEQHQKMIINRDMDNWVKARDREAQIIHKEVDALSKKLSLVTGQNDLPGNTAEISSLHLGLRQIFEAMENFTANSFKSYEELHTCSEEESMARENATIS